jgi:hypothetical protein
MVFPLVAIRVVDTGGKFAAGINDTGCIGVKFAAGVVDTGGGPWLANISTNIRKKFEMTLMPLSEAWGKMIHEKNQKQKISRHCPLTWALRASPRAHRSFAAPLN